LFAWYSWIFIASRKLLMLVGGARARQGTAAYHVEEGQSWVRVRMTARRSTAPSARRSSRCKFGASARARDHDQHRDHGDHRDHKLLFSVVCVGSTLTVGRLAPPRTATVHWSVDGAFTITHLQ